MDETQTLTPTKITRWDLFEFLKKFQTSIQFVVTLIGLVVVLAGLWIASILSPLKQDIAVLQIRANQRDDQIGEIRSTLVRMDGKIDRLLEKQSEK